MSAILYIWKTPVPKGSDSAIEAEQIVEELLTKEGDFPQLYVDFINDLTLKYPDITELSDDEVDDSPWSDGPLINNATPGLCTLGLVWSGYEEAAPFVFETAKKHGLVAYDPQEGIVHFP